MFRFVYPSVNFIKTNGMNIINGDYTTKINTLLSLLIDYRIITTVVCCVIILIYTFGSAKKKSWKFAEVARTPCFCFLTAKLLTMCIYYLAFNKNIPAFDTGYVKITKFISFLSLAFDIICLLVILLEARYCLKPYVYEYENPFKMLYLTIFGYLMFSFSGYFFITKLPITETIKYACLIDFWTPGFIVAYSTLCFVIFGIFKYFKIEFGKLRGSK